MLPQAVPAAAARIIGGSRFPSVRGSVYFFPSGGNTYVAADIQGLPQGSGPCKNGFFALHIHEGGACSGTDFADTGGHYNPQDCPHPYHAGDLPPLKECGGRAFLIALADRLPIEDILGRTVVIHGGTDDFTSQPAGNSGVKIACGVIRPIR